MIVRSPGNYNNIHTKPVTAHNQTLSPRDALLTGGARVGLGSKPRVLIKITQHTGY